MNKNLRKGSVKWSFSNYDQSQRDNGLDGIGVSSACWGTCGSSRKECLKKRHANVEADVKLMKSLEKRYDSMIQTFKQNTHAIPLYYDFSILRFKHTKKGN